MNKKILIAGALLSANLAQATDFEVSGYVQNLKDGRVRLEAEGNIVEINLFLDALKDELDHYIKEIEVHTSSRVPQLTGFLIS